jgi:hypothetical protein
MKNFLHFVGEDIDLFSGMKNDRAISGTFSEYHKELLRGGGYSNIKVNWMRRRLGIPGFTLYHYKFTQATSASYARHVFVVVHDQTDAIALEATGKGVRIGRKPDPRNPAVTRASWLYRRQGKTIVISALVTSPQFRKANLGFSLPQETYKAITRDGYTLVSDEAQTLGGASVWQALRQDPETAERMDLYDPNDETIEPAGDLPDQKIWSTVDRTVMRSMKRIKAGIPVSAGSNAVGERRLVLRGLKKRV